MRRATDGILSLLLDEQFYGQRYPEAIRQARLEQVAKLNTYHQRRNAAARASHGKRRQRELLAAGVTAIIAGGS